MPWKVSNIVNERMKFVLRRDSGEKMTDLCKEFDISRKTGYKFYNRYKEQGPEGLKDRSHEPIRKPHKMSEEVQQLILAAKHKYPSWGGRKLKTLLERLHPGLRIPAASTIGDFLKRNNLVKPRKRRRSCMPSLTPLKPSTEPNDIWCMDFKGQFRLGTGSYCYPFTITDHFSRYIIGCEAYENTRCDGVRDACEFAFGKYGLPRAIRTDNGAPFASTGLYGLSRISVWWMRLGIQLERIEPGHPEQNGRHERMHLTLKEETTRPAGENFLQQQERFDRFIETFNKVRPHEGLGMKRPKDVYIPSPRPYTPMPSEIKYPLHDMTRKVSQSGHINLGRHSKVFYLSSALGGEVIGLREIENDCWLVSFLDLDLATINTRTNQLMILDPNLSE